MNKFWAEWSLLRKQAGPEEKFWVCWYQPEADQRVKHAIEYPGIGVTEQEARDMALWWPDQNPVVCRQIAMRDIEPIMRALYRGNTKPKIALPDGHVAQMARVVMEALWSRISLTCGQNTRQKV